MSDIAFTTKTAVTAVLGSADFEPPVAPSTTTGATADLRADMARFSGPELHPARRAALESCIAAIADVPFDTTAMERTAVRLDRAYAKGRDVDAVADLGFIVPTEVLGTALATTDGLDLDALRSDMLAIAKVIGRQEPTTAEANDAVVRVLERFGEHPSGPVAPISLLYQNHDATAALLGVTLLAHHNGVPRRSALAGTVRTATQSTMIEQVEVPAGTTVALDLESTGLEFGAGPHQCPGQEIAGQIVHGITAAIDASSYTLAADLIEFDPNGRPLVLPLRST